MIIAKIFSNLFHHKEKTSPTKSKNSILYYSEPKKAFIPAKQITGILNSDKPYFWNHHGNTIDDYLRLAEKSKILYQKWQEGTSLSELLKDPDCKNIADVYLDENQMVQVYKISDNEYKWANDGRHRAAASQVLDIHILVKILGEYII